jgi:hypothetical protein
LPKFIEQLVLNGHGRLEKRVVSLCTTLDNIKPWPGLKTLVGMESERQFKHGETIP